MANFTECNSSQDRVYTTVNRELLSSWLQTWTNQPAEISTVRSLQISTGHAQGILELNPKGLKRTRQRHKAIS
jgi:hypothetical protein